MSKNKFPVQSYLVVEIMEDPHSDKIELRLKNGFTVKATKKHFDSYEAYKKSVEQHILLRKYGE